MSGSDRARCVELLALYRSPAGTTRYDEHVTEVEHALQCADRAIDADAHDALVVAALFHDIGHLLPGGAAVITPTGDELAFPAADDAHQTVGARALRRWFGPDVTAPVALHVDAKRYLCGTDMAYHDTLSPSSVHSLAMQGGPMNDDEVAAFRRRQGWADAVRLRRWDDAAKVPGAPTRSLSDHRERIVALVTR